MDIIHSEHQIFSVRPGMLIRVKKLDPDYGNPFISKVGSGKPVYNPTTGLSVSTYKRLWLLRGTIFCVTAIVTYDHQTYDVLVNKPTHNPNDNTAETIHTRPHPDGRVFVLECISLSDGCAYQKKLYLNKGWRNTSSSWFNEAYNLPISNINIERSFEDMFEVID